MWAPQKLAGAEATEQSEVQRPALVTLAISNDPLFLVLLGAPRDCRVFSRRRVRYLGRSRPGAVSSVKRCGGRPRRSRSCWSFPLRSSLRSRALARNKFVMASVLDRQQTAALTMESTRARAHNNAAGEYAARLRAIVAATTASACLMNAVAEQPAAEPPAAEQPAVQQPAPRQRLPLLRLLVRHRRPPRLRIPRPVWW